MIRHLVNIHFDYTTHTEVSYHEVWATMKESSKEVGLQTHCLDFFCFDYLDICEVIVWRKDGRFISMSQLLLNDGSYTDKEIRKEHNIHKMLKSGAFKWNHPEGTAIEKAIMEKSK